MTKNLKDLEENLMPFTTRVSKNMMVMYNSVLRSCLWFVGLVDVRGFLSILALGNEMQEQFFKHHQQLDLDYFPQHHKELAVLYGN